MQLHARVSRSLIELVKRFEGLRRGAAQLPDGGWTIGYGHTRSAREGAVVSPEDAEALLYYDLSEVARKVDAWTFTPLNQNQFEALTAFAFNIGLENFRRSTVLAQVNEGRHLQAAATLERWRKAEISGEGLVVDALVRRRAAEKAHYLTPPDGFRPSPTPVIRPMFDPSTEAVMAGSGRSASVVDTPLQGEMAAIRLEEAAAPGSGDAPFPVAAPAADATSASLHQRFPGDGETAETATGAPVVLLETALPPTTAEAQAEMDVEEGAPPPSPAELREEEDRSDPLLDAPIPPLGHAHPLDARDSVDPHAGGLSKAFPRGRPRRSMMYLTVGLLGAALFLAALFSMLGGKATPANLIVGLAGILLMAPSSGYFLLRALNRGESAPEL